MTDRQDRASGEMERVLECLTAEFNAEIGAWKSGPSGVRAQAIAHTRQALLILKPFTWVEIKPGVYVARGEA